MPSGGTNFRFQSLLLLNRLIIKVRPPGATSGLYKSQGCASKQIYEGWKFNSGNYLFTTDTK